MADHLQRIRKAAERVDRANAAADAARRQFRQSIRDAVASGVTQVAIAKELDVSRQRIRQLLLDD